MARGRAVWVCLAATAAVLSVLPLPAEASFPGSNGKISFTRFYYNTISTINPDGSGEQLLLDSPPRRNDAAWSADGTRLVYRRGNPPSGDPGLAVVNADGTDDHFIRNDPAAVEHDPSWSPDGAKIAYWRAGSDDGVMFVTNADGSGPATPLTTADSRSTQPDWSPDGTKIVFTREALRFPGDYELPDIWTMNADGTGKVNLTDTLGLREADPHWSPDGSKIVFWSESGGVTVMDADGGNKTSVIPSASQAVWSPDGTKIAYFYDFNAGVWIADADGTDPVMIRQADDNPVSLDWQPLPVPYPRPKGATPLRVTLVPAYALCSAPNRMHGPPLAYSSCTPPAQESSQLTVGTSDANGAPANMAGFVRYDSILGNPATPADEADVALRVEITDVRELGSLADYAGEVEAQAQTRLTDHEGAITATASDVRFPLTTQCTPTADPDIGSTCSLTTTLDTLIPGAVVERTRTILQLGQVRVVDGGPDGDTATEPNTVFLRQGVFIP